MIQPQIKIDLAEYLALRSRAGQLNWTIDEMTREEIISQPNWESICYINPIPNRLEGERRLFQCWKLEDWKINSKFKVIEREKKEVREQMIESNERIKHNKFASNCQRMLDFLISKGMNRFDALKQVEHAKNPRVEVKEELDLETLEFVKVEKYNERDLKFQKHFGLDYGSIEI